MIDFKNLSPIDQKMLGAACHFSGWSHYRVKVGCVLANHGKSILATGHNDLPLGVEDPEGALDHQREMRRMLMQHAEANAISQAARHGIATQGATAYVTHPCCAQCAGQLVCAGVQRVVHFNMRMHPSWNKNLELSQFIFSKNNIECVSVKPQPNAYTKHRRIQRFDAKGTNMEPMVQAALDVFFENEPA